MPATATTLGPFFTSDVFLTPDCWFTEPGCSAADFPVDWGVVGTFNYTFPGGQQVEDVLIQGTWGGGFGFGGTAPVQVLLEGILVAECVIFAPCWDNASTVDWNGGVGFLLSDLGVDFSSPAVRALFEDGSADLAVVQSDLTSANLTNLSVELSVLLDGDGIPDNRGTEFMLGFMENNFQSGVLVLFITGDVATNGNVEIPGLAFSEAFAVAPGTVTSVTIPLGARVLGSDTVSTLGIRVTADDPVVVYGLNQDSLTTDAFLGLPTDSLGAEHFVLGFDQVSLNTGTTSEFLIVGVEDGTNVAITPSITTGGRLKGQTYFIVLNRFDTYQLQSDHPGEDLSGSAISSFFPPQPIAVFGGGQCINVPVSTLACDHIVEQLPHTGTWGVSFLTVPLATRTAGDVFRIIAQDDGTEVRIDGVLVATIGLDHVQDPFAEFHETDLMSGTFHEIEATEPVMVMQYSKGSAADNVQSDPFMMVVPPIQQFRQNYTLSTPAAAPVAFNNFINLVVETPDIGSCTIDGGPFTAAFSPIGASGFSGAQESVSIGSHVLSCPSPFGVYSYGFGPFDSYGYPAGLRLVNLAATPTPAATPTATPTPTPEPNSLTALGSGIAVLALLYRRRRRGWLVNLPEPHPLILQGVGVLALAGLGRLRRKRSERFVVNRFRNAESFCKNSANPSNPACSPVPEFQYEGFTVPLAPDEHGIDA
jgi:hypothetical protein